MKSSFFLIAILSTLQVISQETKLSLESNLVILCGPQDVFKKSSKDVDYKKTYTWPSGTYTLFMINSADKVFSYQQMATSEVDKALNQYSSSGEILTYLQSRVNQDQLIKYEIMDEINSTVSYTGNMINGYIYILKLPHQDATQVNTTAELSEGKVSVTSINMEGQPYQSVYPLMHHEVLTKSK